MNISSRRPVTPERARRGAGWRAVATAGVALGLAGTALTASGSALASGSGQSHEPKPTIVLVHGAWADGASWGGEVRLLQKKGYTVDVAPNYLRGVAADSAQLRQYLGTISGPIVLVGHSYGGVVITNAATGVANVKALVYVDAFAPDEGESIGALTQGSGSVLEPALTDPAAVFTLRPFAGAPSGAVDAYVLPDVFRRGFAADLPADEAAVLGAEQLPLATNAFAEASGVPAWKTIPSWSVVGTEDRVIPRAAQELMAKRAGAHVVRVDGSHLTLVSHPGRVTDVIVTAATSVSR